MLLTQPRSGWTAKLEDIIADYLEYFKLWSLIALIILIAAKNTDKYWAQIVFGKRTLFGTITLLSIVGFILNFDYQRQSGCFVVDETMYSPTKFIFIICSFLLLSYGYYYSDRKVGQILLVTEFIFWTFKALYYNSSLDLIFPGYFTMMSWTLRFALIVKILNHDVQDTITTDKKATH